MNRLDGHARLSGYDRSNIGAQVYTYNGLGDRVRVDKPTGSRHFVYDTQGRVLAGSEAERAQRGQYGASAGEVWAEFIWAQPPGANDNAPFGGGDGVAGYAPLALVAQNISGLPELYWVHGNHLGVPQVTTSASGQVTDPGADFLRPGFPGQAQVLTDLYYNRARDYDPVLGRYIQADPIGLMGDVNPYLYAGADPVNMVDPLGLQSSPSQPSAGQLVDVALEWWAKRQLKNATTRRIPLAGQALSAGDALGAALAVARFCYDHADGEEPDEDGPCEDQKREDEMECNQWHITGGGGGLTRKQGYAACIRTVMQRYGECRSRGMNPRMITTPLFLPTGRRGGPDRTRARR